MEDADAQRQIDQMVKFILNEAKDKAEEIEAKSLEDFNIEKLKIVQQMKDKVRQDYRKKAKQLETEKAIARSTAINKARLKKITARQLKINEAVKAAAKALSELSKDTHKYPRLCCDLIVQAMLRLLEEEVLVRVRPEDERMISDILRQAEDKYLEILKDAGVNGTIKASIDTRNYLATGNVLEGTTPGCSGGVVVTSVNGKLLCDNTLDARLNLVVAECLPQLRRIIYENPADDNTSSSSRAAVGGRH